MVEKESGIKGYGQGHQQCQGQFEGGKLTRWPSGWGSWWPCWGSRRTPWEERRPPPDRWWRCPEWWRRRRHREHWCHPSSPGWASRTSLETTTQKKRRCSMDALDDKGGCLHHSSSLQIAPKKERLGTCISPFPNHHQHWNDESNDWFSPKLKPPRVSLCVTGKALPRGQGSYVWTQRMSLVAIVTCRFLRNVLVIRYTLF